MSIQDVETKLRLCVGQLVDDDVCRPAFARAMSSKKPRNLKDTTSSSYDASEDADINDTQAWLVEEFTHDNVEDRSPSPTSTRQRNKQCAADFCDGGCVQLTDEQEKALANWDFQPWEHAHDLEKFVIWIFQKFNFLDQFKVPISNMQAFVRAVMMNYNDNPYHNWEHAFSVLHASFLLIKLSKTVSEYLTDIEVFSLFVAALVHDVGHTGNTNQFEISNESELALQYNDQSVLENHHCSMCFHLMNGDADILVGLEGSQYTYVRRVIISAVLNTDMSNHFDLVDKLRAKNSSGTFNANLSGIDEVDEKNAKQIEDNHIFMVKTLLHSADICNPARPFHVYCKFADRIATEMGNQVQKEKELGLKVTASFDNITKEKQAKMEVGFIDFIVFPLFQELQAALPELSQLCDTIRENRNEWLKRSEGGQHLAEQYKMKGWGKIRLAVRATSAFKSLPTETIRMAPISPSVK